MHKTLAHGIQIKKASFQVDQDLISLKNFKGTVLKSSDIRDFTLLKDKHIALLGFSPTLLKVLNHALPHASFIKLFCENPTWVLTKHQSVFSVFSPISSERIDRIRQNSQREGFFSISAQDTAVIFPLKKAKQNLKQIQNEWLARQLTPNHLNTQHTFIFNDDFYQDIQHSRVKVMTWPVVQIMQDSILTMEGIQHLVDVIITAD